MARPDAERVAVTGVGVVTPVGNDVPTTWAALLAGHSGVGPITRCDVSDIKCRIAAEVKNFDPEQFMERREARRMDRFLHLAVAAVHEAMADSGLCIDALNAERVGVLVGSGIGGLETLLAQADVLRDRGPRRVSPFTVPALMLNSASATISMMFGAHGPNLAIATACATGSHSIGEAAAIIRRRQADVMIAGGTEAGVIRLAVAGFDQMSALSNHNEEPQKASRPFDALRDGFVIGEGAGILVLERLDLARARGARIYGEVAGYGATADAYHITAPAENGVGATRSMQLAMIEAELAPGQIDYINAHGTSTPLNDAVETIAIKSAFGDQAYRVPISSTKSMTGHLMGAAGAVEAVFSLLAIRDQILPPTINLEHKDPACDLDYVPNQARPTTVNTAMSNSFGFGGHNATLLFRRVS